MKINDSSSEERILGSRSERARQSYGVRSGSGTANTESASWTGSDQVDISGLASLATQSSEGAGSTRKAYVDRISTSVRDGSYQVDSAAVSRKLVDDALGGAGMR